MSGILSLEERCIPVFFGLVLMRLVVDGQAGQAWSNGFLGFPLHPILLDCFSYQESSSSPEYRSDTYPPVESLSAAPVPVFAKVA